MAMLFENIKLSAGQLWAHKLRAFLTVLSITIGVAAIVAMTSLAQSGFATLTAGIEEIGGTRFIWIIPDKPKKAKTKRDAYVHTLTLGDRDAIAAAVPTIDWIVASKAFYHVPVFAFAAPSVVTTVLATEPGYFSAYKMRLAYGRPFSPDDLEAQRPVAVIGAKLASKLYGGSASALDKEVTFRGTRFRVIGVLTPNQKSNVQLGYNWDELVLIPVNAPVVGENLEEISLTVKHTEDGERAIRIANAILLHRHHGVDNFQFLDFGGLLKNFYLAFNVMKMVVALIAGISLLIGGVGVMNIMLVSVNERMREIGLRKAIGATKAMILGQFLIEAVVLSLFGGVLGIGLGIATAEAGSWFIHYLNPSWVKAFSYSSLLVAVAAATAVGLFFGYYPAKRAAELEPIQCLRHE